MVPSNNLFSISVSSWLNCSQPASAVASVVDSSASTWLFWRGSARLRRSALLLRSLLLSRLIWETWLLCQRWSVPWWESTTARPSTRWKSRWAPFAISPTPSEMIYLVCFYSADIFKIGFACGAVIGALRLYFCLFEVEIRKLIWAEHYIFTQNYQKVNYMNSIVCMSFTSFYTPSFLILAWDDQSLLGRILHHLQACKAR